MTNTYFVTGTDTETGKTIASCALLQVVGQLGLRMVGYKPVASGSETTAEGLRDSDALALQRNSIVAVDYTVINPYTFAEPTSSHIISADERRPTQASIMSAGLCLLEERIDWVLVESAGGWFTPLSSMLSSSDWAGTEQLPVIPMVGIKLDCINYAISTVQAMQQAGPTFAGWIANDVQPSGERHTEYMAILKRAFVAPLLGEVPRLAEDPERATTSRYTDLSVSSLAPASR